MATRVRPAKNFDFVVEIGGVNRFYVQSLTLPTVGSARVTHGAPGRKKNPSSPGKETIGDLVLTHLVPADETTDDPIWNKLWAAYTGDPDVYLEEAIFGRIKPGTVDTVIERYRMTGLWVAEQSFSEFNYNTEGENVISTLTFEVGDYYKIGSQLETAKALRE